MGRERFGKEVMVNNYLSVYEKVLEMERHRARHADPPWGRWEVLLEETTYKVKRVTVLPGKRLSYQKHSIGMSTGALSAVVRW